MGNQLTAYNLFQGALYSTNANFSSVFDILNVLEKRLKELPYDLEVLLNEMDRYISIVQTELQTPLQPSDELCFLDLFLQDLLSIRNQALSIDDTNLEQSLSELWTIYKQILDDLSIDLSGFPELFFVDKYPDPVSENTWAAGSFFNEDAKHYGMKRGIYFRHDTLAPRVSANLLAHEITHFTMERDGKIIPRRLEEGFCDLLGSCYMGGKVLGFETSFTIVKNSLFNDPSDSLLWLYAANLSQASFIYRQYGFEGMAYCISQEQKHEFFQSMEKKVLLGKVMTLDLPIGNIDTIFLNKLDSLVATPIHFVLTPLCFAVIKGVVNGFGFNQVLEKYRLTKSELDVALQGLAIYPLLLVEGDKIVSEIASNYLDTNVLRYKVNTERLSRIISKSK